MHPQQTTFINIVTKEEIAQNEQFLLLSQCLQLFLIIKLSFMEIFHVFVGMFQMSSAAIKAISPIATMFSILF